jgi:hypothetical protein
VNELLRVVGREALNDCLRTGAVAMVIGKGAQERAGFDNDSVAKKHMLM